ncbi:G-type lectin S-receptor serine/threonine-protein kinase [Salix suchowensis]|nr:G-type lectin S-receptor serine/threonine-protein kinase [Salix suchowensis]
MAPDLPCILYYFFFFLLLPSSLVAQSNGNVTVGDSLTAGDEAALWLSPAEDFAFGFRQLGQKDLYLLAIWYYKIPNKTIIWYANGDSPAPKESTVKLTAELGVVLNNPQGGEIWKSGPVNGEAASGFMNDTGNFLVANENGEKLWQSFDFPTDTLLPTQIMEKDTGGLSSRLSETNFSRGRFQFRLIGTEMLNTVDSGYQVVFNESGYLYVLRANNEREPLTLGSVVSATENYHRATLNFDGVFVLYSHPKNSSGNERWSVVRTMPENICINVSGKLGTGPCGFNGVCTISPDQRANCSCPQRFLPLDPDDPYGGCKPDFPTQVCTEDVPNAPEDYELVTLTNIDWPESDYEMYTPYNIEDCKKACLQDCFCNVIVFTEGKCWKKKLPLSNGRQDASVNRVSFIKVRNYTLPGPPPIPKENLLLGGSMFFNLVLAGVVSFAFLFSYHNKFTRTPQVERAVQSNLRCFSYKDLVHATNGFKEEVGRGSFGIVYKGLIQIGSGVPVAIKKLHRFAKEIDKEFKTEVDAIAHTHHKNLVRLIGFCDEGQHRMLVYEFLSNGALASFLYGDVKLSWNQRTQIAFQIARGLLYLHDECSTQIIHCDIKPQNILLDEHYDARIADFGLAKLLVCGAGMVRSKLITAKVDVYSFGVVLLEIICCRKCVDSEESGERAILTDWAYDCYQAGMMHALVENDEEALDDMEKFERFVMVAVWCIQEDPNLRPTMKMVMLMLEGIIQVDVPPCPSPSTSYTGIIQA